VRVAARIKKFGKADGLSPLRLDNEKPRTKGTLVRGRFYQGIDSQMRKTSTCLRKKTAGSGLVLWARGG